MFNHVRPPLEEGSDSITTITLCRQGTQLSYSNWSARESSITSTNGEIPTKLVSRTSPLHPLTLPFFFQAILSSLLQWWFGWCGLLSLIPTTSANTMICYTPVAWLCCHGNIFLQQHLSVCSVTRPCLSLWRVWRARLDTAWGWMCDTLVCMYV